MKAWLVDHFGNPDEMRFGETALPEPGANEVRIRHRAAALNFFDLLLVQGKYQEQPPFPFSPGAEVAGVIDAVGPGVKGLTVGQKVIGFVNRGGYAEHSVTHFGGVFPLPEGWTFAEGAAFPIVYQTSYCGLVTRGALQAGEWLLVHAGASGVGMAAIQIGKALGAKVIATCGSPAKQEFCKSIGADEALDYRDPAWVERVNEITGKRGANVIYDPVGGDVCELSTKCIASGGRLLVVGFTSGKIPSIPANRILLKSMSLVGVFWGRQVKENPRYPLEVHQALLKLGVKPVVTGEFPLADALKAMQAVAQREVCGKVVLTMPE